MTSWLTLFEWPEKHATPLPDEFVVYNVSMFAETSANGMEEELKTATSEFKKFTAF